MSFSETIFLFVLALIVFGPKKLPEIARQAGRLMAELRRASNEFKAQIEAEVNRVEIEKNEKTQTILPPGQPPPGAVASHSLKPATSEATATESTFALSESTPEPVAAAAENPPASLTPTPPAVDPESAPITQDSHV